MKKLLIILLFISFKVDANIRLGSNELNCLIRNAYFEANLEGDIGMLLVTNVVFNRTKNGKYCSTIFSKNQFSWTSGKRRSIPVNIYNDIKSNINMFSKRSIPRRFVDATHYHKRGENPKWAHRLKYLGAYKHHLFYKV